MPSGRPIVPGRFGQLGPLNGDIEGQDGQGDTDCVRQAGVLLEELAGVFVLPAVDVDLGQMQGALADHVHPGV